MKTPDSRRPLDARLLNLMECLPDPTVVVNAKGSILLLNSPTEILFGYTRDEILGRTVEILLPPRFRNLHSQHFSIFVASPRRRPMGAGLELFGMHKDGREFPVEISLSPIRLDEEPVVFCAIRDISEYKRFEQILREKNQELEAFNYTVAHDLRSPLRNIRGYIQVLIEDHADEIHGTANQQLHTIRATAEHMARLLDDLLRFSRLGLTDVRRDKVDLNLVVAKVVNELEPETRKRNLEWRIAPLPQVDCDPVLIEQVFVNLLSNAVKYTRRRPQALIEAGTMQKNSELVFLIRDNGVGFDMKDAGRLFGVFKRLHRSEDYEGTGAGLAIVQRILHKHNGRIWAESEPDRGTTFFFTIGSSMA